MLLPWISAFCSSVPPLNMRTTQVTPFSAAHFSHSGWMALAVLAELSAQTVRVEAPPAAPPPQAPAQPPAAPAWQPPVPGPDEPLPPTAPKS